MTVTDSEWRCVTAGLLFTGNGSELISRRFLLIVAELHSNVTKTGEERSSVNKKRRFGRNAGILVICAGAGDPAAMLAPDSLWIREKASLSAASLGLQPPCSSTPYVLLMQNDTTPGWQTC